MAFRAIFLYGQNLFLNAYGQTLRFGKALRPRREGQVGVIVYMLHRYDKAPAGQVIFFLRHRQACQKLRKNIASTVGLVLLDYVFIGEGWQ